MAQEFASTAVDRTRLGPGSGIEHPASEQALSVVLDHATPASLKHLGLDVTGVRLEADDGSGTSGAENRSAAAPATSWC